MNTDYLITLMIKILINVLEGIWFEPTKTLSWGTGGILIIPCIHWLSPINGVYIYIYWCKTKLREYKRYAYVGGEWDYVRKYIMKKSYQFIMETEIFAFIFFYEI